MDRREFVRIVAALGGAAVLAPFVEACSRAGIDPESAMPPTGTPVPPAAGQTLAPIETSAPETAAPAGTATQPSPTTAPTEANGAARIAFIQTTDRAAGVRRAIDLLGINPVSGQRVFLKPNFNSADPAPGSTHPDVLRSLVMALQGMGAAKITVGDRSGMGDTRQVMQQLGVFDLAQELDFEAIVLDELAAEDWAPVQPPAGHWQQGFHIARPCVEADAVVQTCNLKTHRYGGHFTLSLKNSVGLVAKRLPLGDYNFMQELHASPHQRRMIAEINAAYTPALVILDGVEAFISGGPDVGERVSPGVVLAGTDRIALDAVGVALLRFFGCQTEAGQGKIFEQEQIARAVELGIGIDHPDKIEFVTGDADSAVYSQKIMDVLRAG